MVIVRVTEFIIGITMLTIQCVWFLLVFILNIYNIFSYNCASLPRDARVVKDMTTGKSKGYGFVSFYNKLVSTLNNTNHCFMLCEFNL